MFPIARNILHILMEKSLLTQADIVDGSSIFAFARQRNRFCYFKRLIGPSYFIKTGHEEDPNAARAMALEAAVLQHLFTDPNFAVIRPYLVQLFHFDPDTATLISELVAQGEDLTVVAERTPEQTSAHLAKLAECLANLHGAQTSLLRTAELGFNPKPHWIFRLASDPGPLPQLRARSAAGRQTIDRIAGHPGWSEMLAALGAAMSQSSLIHGDVKPQNFLVHPGSDTGFGYKLIDWERAALGDPCWDVACAVATPLMPHAFAQGGSERAFTPDELLSGEVRRDMAAVLNAYRKAAPAALTHLVSTHRCTQMVIARLLAAAYELTAVMPPR